MTEPDIRVTGELRDMGDHWTASAYGGSIEESIEVHVTAETEGDAKAAFIITWNERAGTTWTDDQFGWDYNYGRADDQEG